jgi:hypothetical protein
MARGRLKERGNLPGQRKKVCCQKKTAAPKIIQPSVKQTLNKKPIQQLKRIPCRARIFSR